MTAKSTSIPSKPEAQGVEDELWRVFKYWDPNVEGQKTKNNLYDKVVSIVRRSTRPTPGMTCSYCNGTGSRKHGLHPELIGSVECNECAGTGFSTPGMTPEDREEAKVLLTHVLHCYLVGKDIEKASVEMLTALESKYRLVKKEVPDVR